MTTAPIGKVGIWGPAVAIKQLPPPLSWWMLVNEAGHNCWGASRGAVFIPEKEVAERELAIQKELWGKP